MSHPVWSASLQYWRFLRLSPEKLSVTYTGNRNCGQTIRKLMGFYFWKLLWNLGGKVFSASDSWTDHDYFPFPVYITFVSMDRVSRIILSTCWLSWSLFPGFWLDITGTERYEVFSGVKVAAARGGCFSGFFWWIEKILVLTFANSKANKTLGEANKSNNDK